MISPSQRPLPGNTQHLQETDTHAPGGIRTRNPQQASSRRPTLMSWLLTVSCYCSLSVWRSAASQHLIVTAQADQSVSLSTLQLHILQLLKTVLTFQTLILPFEYHVIFHLRCHATCHEGVCRSGVIPPCISESLLYAGK